MKSLVTLLCIIVSLTLVCWATIELMPNANSSNAFANVRSKSNPQAQDRNPAFKSSIQPQLSTPIAIAPASGVEKESDPRDTPLREDILRDAARDTHSAPQSLIDFAKSMGQPMHRALQNVSEAESLFPKLSECALDKSGTRTRTLKAYCLANATIVAQAHTSLSSAMDNLNGLVESEVVSLASRLKSSSNTTKEQ